MSNEESTHTHSDLHPFSDAQINRLERKLAGFFINSDATPHEKFIGIIVAAREYIKSLGDYDDTVLAFALGDRNDQEHFTMLLEGVGPEGLQMAGRMTKIMNKAAKTEYFKMLYGGAMKPDAAETGAALGALLAELLTTAARTKK